METLKGVAQPAFELAYNGKAITAGIAPYVLAITYTDHLTGESDELDVELEDTAGRWLDAWYPEKGANLTLSFGFLGRPLVKAGVFNVDEIELSGPPSVVRMRGLATGVQDAVRTRKGRAYEKTTLAAIAQRIAKRHKMKLIGKVEALQIDRATQYHESDLQFLVRHWLRKCLEISLDVRPIRWRRLRFALFFLPGDFGPADHDYGVQRGPGGTGEPHQNVSKTGEKGPEMAHSWVCFVLWERGPDGVLHGGHRVDRVLFCAVSDGKYPGSGIFVHDYKPGG